MARRLWRSGSARWVFGRRSVVGVVSAAVVLTGLGPVAESASAASRASVSTAGALKVQTSGSVPSSPVTGHVPSTVPMPDFVGRKVSLPSPGSALVAVPGVGAAPSRVAGTAVSVAAPGVLADLQSAYPGIGTAPGGATTSVPTSPPGPRAQVQVDVDAPDVAARAGGYGVSFSVSAGPGEAAGRVGVSVDVSGIEGMFGGGFASRLRLSVVPACAIDAARAGTVAGDGCPAPTPVPSWVDPATGLLVADIDVPAGAAPATASTGQAVVSGAAFRSATSTAQPAALTAATSSSTTTYAVTSGTSSQEGSYDQAPTTVAATWQVGLSSGDFSYSYPIPAAPAMTGGVPGLALAYSSASVDGLTAGDNSQVSDVGIGWDLQVPYIEQLFEPCSQDISGSSWGDNCWAGDHYRLTMNGHSSLLVPDNAVYANGADQVFRLQDDPGWRVELRSGISNGDNGGDWWTVVTTDGTKYQFGRGKIAGPTGSTTDTNSVWTEPVVGDDAGEPCHASTLSSSWCTQAWRWNLDRVVDLHGNQTAYFYSTSTNSYLRMGTTTTSYIRAGRLSRVEYDARVTGPAHSPQWSQDPRAKILFGYSTRCTDRATGDFLTSSSPTCPSLTAANASHYPDVPMDLVCSSSCTQTSPTFFSSTQLAAVTSYRLVGSSFQTVDHLDMATKFPDNGDGTDPSLWLQKVRRIGQSTAPNVTVPFVQFGMQGYNNRVDYNTSLGVAPLKKYRLAKITDELGAVTDITYGQPSGQTCPSNYGPGPGNTGPTWDLNTKACFPRYWKPDGSSAGWAIFHKYVTLQVATTNTAPGGTENDSTGSAGRVTTYIYEGDAAWHHDDANPVADPSTTSWAEWRGYGEVVQAQGTDPTYRGAPTHYLTKTKTWFFRGMYGDALLGGGTKTDVVTDINGTSLNDYNYLSGKTRQVEHWMLFSGGAERYLAWYSLSDYQVVNTAPDSNPDPITDSFLVVPKVTGTWTAWYDAGNTNAPWGQYTSAFQAWEDNAYGQVTAERDYARDKNGTIIRDVCTKTLYAGDTTAQENNLVSYPAQVTTFDIDASGLHSCDNVDGTTTILSRTRYLYDGNTAPYPYLGTTLTQAEVTDTLTADDPAAGNADLTHWIRTSATYDDYGRTITAVDGNGNETDTGYSDPVTSTGAPSITVTKVCPDGTGCNQVTTTDLDPRRLQPVTVTDPNGQTTTTGYDALGRVTAVTRPGDSAATTTVAYFLDPNKALPSSTEVTRTAPNNTTLSTWTFFDSLGRKRQTQQQTYPSASTGSTQTAMRVTNTRYDELGRVEATSQPAATDVDNANLGSMVTIALADLNETRTSYDALSRTTESDWYHGTTSEWSTTSTYYGDHTTITPPAGGVSVTSYVDAAGRTASRVEGSSPSTATTQYGYDELGRVATITDPGGHVSSYGYDIAGRRVTSTDPDAGTTTTGYDDNGNPVTVTRTATNPSDPTSAATTTTYDWLNRATKILDTSTDSPNAAVKTVNVYDIATPNGIGRLAKVKTWDAAGNEYIRAITGYTDRGQPTGTKWTFPAGLGGTTSSTDIKVTTSYDILDRPSTVHYTADAPGLPAETVTTGYDTVGAADSLTGANTYVDHTSYNGDGTLAGRTYSGPNGATTDVERAYTWEPVAKRLATVQTSVAGATVQNDAYTWDNSGNLTTVTDTVNNAVSCFSYDPLDRLSHGWTTAQTCDNTDVTSAAGPAGYNSTWTYTPDGNIDTVRRVGGSAAGYGYTDSAHPHAATSNGTGAAYTYDALGQMTTRTTGGATQNLVWDTGGHLASATDTATGDTTSFVAEADGTRLSRTTPDGTTTVYAGGEEIDIKNGTVQAGRRYYAIAGTLVAIRATGTGLTWQVNDRQGSVDLQVNDTTGAVSRMYTDPFGMPRTGTATPATDRGWLDKTLDPTTGLTQVGARYYDTSLGRFLTTDPLMDGRTSQTGNPYTYSSNNPVSFSDPTGLMLLAGGGSGGVPTTSSASGSPGFWTQVLHGVESSNPAATWLANKLWRGSVVVYKVQVLNDQQTSRDVLAGFVQAAGNTATIMLGQPGLIPSWNSAANGFEKNHGINVNSDAHAVGEVGFSVTLGIATAGAGAVDAAAADGLEELAVATTDAAETGASGPVTFRPPPGATAEEVAQTRAYVEGCNAALCAGELSPTGRVSTQGALRADASRAAAAERARGAAGGTPYSGHAGHVPDTTWTGSATPPSWMDLTPRVNTSLGGQAVQYPVGYRPTIFEFLDR